MPPATHQLPPPPHRHAIANMTFDIVRHCRTQRAAAYRLGITVGQLRTLIKHPETPVPDRLAFRIRTCHQLATGRKVG
ncbi:hypothetical protein [Corynebacterium sp. AOP12-C2-36]|uniref:hypothetical protein n=1 Tax=Corynebacterium sp. AOP12-C2-36 TaxID=3457723 RepID=UPI004033F70A